MSKEPKATNMFSPTTTRFFASLTMTLVMWMACWVGAVAEEPFNPPPCNDPWECYEKPQIGGLVRGTSIICGAGSADISVYDDIKPGKKIRCELEKEVDANKIDWKWKVTGPEAAEGTGDHIDNQWSKPGVYTATFTGTSTSKDPVCDDPDSTSVTFEFTVYGPSFTVMLSIDPSTLCPGEYAKAIGTFTDNSFCDPGAYNVSWELKNFAGQTGLSIAPEKGTVALSFGATKTVEMLITMNANSAAGISFFELTGTHADVTASGYDETYVVELLSVTHNTPEYRPWTYGATVVATAVVEGELGNKEILYEARNTKTGAIVASLSVASTSATLPIMEPGKYRIEVTLCDKTVLALPFFTLWQVVFEPEETVVVWDDLIDNVLNPEPWKAVEDSQKAINQAVADGTLGGVVALAVAGAIGMVALIGNLLFDLLAAADPLPNSIKTLFPSESPRNFL